MERMAREYRETAQLLLDHRSALEQRRSLLGGEELSQLVRRMALLRDEALELRRTARLLDCYYKGRGRNE